MKRISLLLLGLCITAWTEGCCCCQPYYSRYADGDDSCDQAAYRRRGRHRRHRADRGDQCANDDGYGGDCCDSCCDSCGGQVGSAGQFAPMSGQMSYDGGMPTMGGCAGGNCAQGAMMNGGCASGNCGSAQTYGAMPFDASSGWTIQSTTSHPVGSEPVPAPPSGATPITPAARQTQGWMPSSAPSPGPVPPPVGMNR